VRPAITGSLLLFLVAATEASANPRPLPFTYIYETLPGGEAEVEQYVDLTPLRAYRLGNPAWYGAAQLQTEFEYGLTDRLELGLYVSFVPSDPAFTETPQLFSGNGIKQRLRYRFAEAGEWPIDLAVYGEVVENQREIELEGKLILQRRLEAVRFVANAWLEREFYFDGEREWVFNPTAGAVLELSPSIQPGIEYWMRFELPDEAQPKAFNRGPHHFVGPTVLIELGKLWWSTGAYLRMNDFGRSPQVGDAFGAVWFRTIVGLSL
jgi:hypothetical protein